MRTSQHSRARRASAPWRAVLVLLFPVVAVDCGTAPPGPTAAPVAPAVRFLDAALACDPTGNIYVAGTERFGVTRQIFVTQSNRYGESWSPRFTYVNTSRDGERGRPQLATGAPGEVYVLWEDTRHGRVDLFFNRSLDAGNTWLSQDVRVTNGILAAVDLAGPVLECDRYGNVYVGWRDASAGYETFQFNHSRDHGATWPATPVAITGVSTAYKSAPSLVCDDQGALVCAWSEAMGNDVTMRATTSSDYGVTWQWQVQTLGRPLVGSYLPRPALAMTPAGVVVAAWVGLAPRQPAVVLARSRDRGRSWDEPRVPGAPSARSQLPTPPQLHAERFGTLYLAWQAHGSDGVPVFIVQTSRDDATNWSEVRLPRTGGWRLVGSAGFQEALVAPFRSAADAAGNLYLAWTEGDAAVRGVGFDRVSNHGSLWLGITRSVAPTGHLPLTAEAPLVCADDAGHVAMLWNEGYTLTVATSAFYGDTGWRFEHF